MLTGERTTAQSNNLDASGGSVFLNLLGAAEGALIRAAASTLTLGACALSEIELLNLPGRKVVRSSKASYSRRKNMYCHTCGARLAQALSYCNHCGANLSTLNVQGQAGTSGTAIDTLLWVIVGTTITLLGMAFGALVLMNNGTINERLGMAFVILTFVALVVSDGILGWRLLHLNREADEIRTVPQLHDLSTDEPDPLTARALHEPLEPVSSVTEQTTRTLEPSYGKGERR